MSYNKHTLFPAVSFTAYLQSHCSNQIEESRTPTTSTNNSTTSGTINSPLEPPVRISTEDREAFNEYVRRGRVRVALTDDDGYGKRSESRTTLAKTAFEKTVSPIDPMDTYHSPRSSC
jgi:hypothetical protein